MDRVPQVLGCRYQPNEPGVAGEIIDGEAIILNLKSGVYFSTSGTGAMLWAAIERQHSLGEILTGLNGCENYDASRDEPAVSRFIGELLHHSLIRPAPPSDDAGPGICDFSQPFADPTLSVYGDMDDLLMLDPIHDVVEEIGWPAPNPALVAKA